MAGARCLMMQRDQTMLLLAWIRHHAHLFGFENLTILDNGSTNAETNAILLRAEAAGADVARHLDDPAEFSRRHAHFANLIGMWNIAGVRYGLALPLECDELLAAYTEDGISCRRDRVNEAIGAVANRSVAVAHGLVDVNASSNEFAVTAMDRTFHAPGADERSGQPPQTSLTCLCFGPRETPTGHVRILYQGLAKQLDALGIGEARFGSPPSTPRGGPDDAVWIRTSPEAPAVRFKGSAYNAANPDVAASGWRPLQHYAQVGSRERRVWA